MTKLSIPIACTLSDPERREREATLIAQFRSGVISVEELADGYTFQVPGHKNWLALVSDLMIAERECCPFLTFQLTAEPNMGALTLRVTGPHGTKEFLKPLMVS
jgi:hypothetical protein